MGATSALSELGIEVTAGSVPLTETEERLLLSFGEFCHSCDDYVPKLWKRATGNWARQVPGSNGFYPAASLDARDPIDLPQLLDELCISRRQGTAVLWGEWKRSHPEARTS